MGHVVSKVPGEEGMTSIHLQLRNGTVPVSALTVLANPSLLNPDRENLKCCDVWLNSSILKYF